MQSIASFADLTSKLLSSNSRKRIAVANAADPHTVEAVLKAVEVGIAEAYLLGDVAEIETPELYANPDILEYIHILDFPDEKMAAVEAVRMVKEGEADVLMKGLVNTDIILRAILDKEKGLLPPGNVLTYNAALEIPGYHKLLFFSDPAVIPYPNLEQRKAMIKYAINTCYKFGIERPKISLVHATEVANPKITFMQDYLDIMQMWRAGEFGDVIMDRSTFSFRSTPSGEASKMYRHRCWVMLMWLSSRTLLLPMFFTKVWLPLQVLKWAAFSRELKNPAY